jgi:SAM-dependent methyltransferase
MLTQGEQDRIWKHLQNEAPGAFDLSYPRLRFLANQCARGTRVLTIGVGNGLLERMLVQHGVELSSLDPSQETIERVGRELGMHERAKAGYAQEIPFASQHFDTVIMTEVLEHLPNDVLHPALDEVRRVLKASGRFIGTVPFQEHLEAGHVICPRCQSSFHRWGHAQSFDIPSLTRLFKEHQFEIDRIYPRAFADFRRLNPRALARAVFRHVLGRLGEPIVGPNLFFAVRPASG